MISVVQEIGAHQRLAGTTQHQHQQQSQQHTPCGRTACTRQSECSHAAPTHCCCQQPGADLEGAVAAIGHKHTHTLFASCLSTDCPTIYILCDDTAHKATLRRAQLSHGAVRCIWLSSGQPRVADKASSPGGQLAGGEPPQCVSHVPPSCTHFVLYLVTSSAVVWLQT